LALPDLANGRLIDLTVEVPPAALEVADTLPGLFERRGS